MTTRCRDALAERSVHRLPLLLLGLGREANEEDDGGHREDADAQEQQGLLRLQGLHPEQEAGAHRSGVAARAHDARHRAQRALVDEGHDRVGGPLRHLHEEAEHQHGDNGQRQDRHLREGDEGDPLQQENAAQEHGAALEAEDLPGLVAERAAQGPGKEVHQPEQAGGQSGHGNAKAEAVVEVERGDVVHGQLDAEARAVDQEQRPHAVVLDGGDEGVLALFPGGAGLVRKRLVPLLQRRVLRQPPVGHAHEEQGHAGHDHRQSPPQELARSQSDHDRQDQGHGHLRHAAAQVAPPGRRRVRRPNHVGGEHHRRVVLRDDEGRSNDADAQPEQEEGLVAVGQSDGHDRNRPDDQQPRVRPPRPDAIAQPPDDEARRDGHQHGGDDGVAHLRLGEAEVIPHNCHHGGNAEPPEEGQEEGHPRHVKGPHVGRRYAEQTDAGGFSGVRVDRGARLQRRGLAGRVPAAVGIRCQLRRLRCELLRPQFPPVPDPQGPRSPSCSAPTGA